MKYRLFISIIMVEIVILAILFIRGAGLARKYQKDIEARRMLVSTLMLTDLSVWTEARYTRHPSQTDVFSPFQDYPSSIEHFPAGSILSPEGVYLQRGGKK